MADVPKPHPMQKYTPQAIVPATQPMKKDEPKDVVMYQMGMMVDPKAKPLSDMVNDSVSYEMIESMLYTDLALQVKHMGYEGHYIMYMHKADCEFKERLDWIDYLDKVFDEHPSLMLHYESPGHFNNLHDVYMCLLEYYRFASARFHMMLSMAHEAKMYHKISVIHEALERATHTADDIAEKIDYYHKQDWNPELIRYRDMGYYEEAKRGRRW